MGREVDGHADVADPGRERPGPAAGDREDRRQPARLEQPAELEDGRVEALDVADLDRRRPGRRGRGDDPSRASADVAASGFSTRTAMPRSMAARASGTWLVVGAAMTTASRSASAIIASGSAKPWAPVAGARPRRARPASGSATATSRTPGMRAEDPQVVAAHRAEPDRARPARSRSPTGGQAPVIGGGALGGARGVGAGRTAARTAAMTVVLLRRRSGPGTSAATASARRRGPSPAGRRGGRAPGCRAGDGPGSGSRCPAPTPAAREVGDDRVAVARRRRACTGGRRGSGRRA